MTSHASIRPDPREGRPAAAVGKRWDFRTLPVGSTSQSQTKDRFHTECRLKSRQDVAVAVTAEKGDLMMVYARGWHSSAKRLAGRWIRRRRRGHDEPRES